MREEEGEGEAAAVHLVLDEAHHLEDTATEALSLVLDHEEFAHQLNRLAHPSKDRGLLKDHRRLRELPEEEQDKAKEVVQKLLPRLREALGNYSRHLVAFIKNRGSGDPRYGLSLGLSAAWKRLEEWPRISQEEQLLIHILGELKAALSAIGQDSRSLMARDLAPLREYLKEALDMLFERRRVLGLAKGEPDPNRLHLSEWDPTTGSWRHLAQPIDVSRARGQAVAPL